jgi:hypothetical protein
MVIQAPWYFGTLSKVIYIYITFIPQTKIKYFQFISKKESFCFCVFNGSISWLPRNIANTKVQRIEPSRNRQFDNQGHQTYRSTKWTRRMQQDQGQSM